MDRETANAIRTFGATMAIMLRRQEEHGVVLAQIVKLLTPPGPGEDQGPTLQDTIKEGFEMMAAGDRRIMDRLDRMARNLPLDTTRAIDDNLGPLAKAPGGGRP